jgi:hypothetical protein
MIEIDGDPKNNELILCSDRTCVRISVPGQVGHRLSRFAQRIHSYDCYIKQEQTMGAFDDTTIKTAVRLPESDLAGRITQVVSEPLPLEPIVVNPNRIETYAKMKNLMEKALQIGIGSGRLVNQALRRLGY